MVDLFLFSAAFSTMRFHFNFIKYIKDVQSILNVQKALFLQSTSILIKEVKAI